MNLNLPEKVVLFDTEYTAWKGCQENGWGEGQYKEIVQIGAILADIGTFKELDNFSVYIKPVKNPELSEYFVDLTHIDQETVDKEGIDLQSALNKFYKWSKDYQLGSFGGDEKTIKENCKLINVKFPFENNSFFDSRKIFENAGIEVKGNYTSGTIPEAFGVNIKNRPHNALNDVRATLEGLELLSQREV